MEYIWYSNYLLPKPEIRGFNLVIWNAYFKIYKAVKCLD